MRAKRYFHLTGSTLCLLTAEPQAVRVSNFKTLELELQQLEREHAAYVSSNIAEEEAALASEQSAFDALIALTEMQIKQTEALRQLTWQHSGSIVFQQLTEHSPEFRFVASLVRDRSQVKQHTPSGAKPCCMLSGYKVFNKELEVSSRCAVHMTRSWTHETISAALSLQAIPQSRLVCSLQQTMRIYTLQSSMDCRCRA